MPDEIPTTFDDARPLLRLRPLGGTQLALRGTLVANAGGTPADVDAAAPVVADLLVGAYLDLPTRNVPVSWAMLETWGASLDELLEAGLAVMPAHATPERVGAATYVDDPGTAAAALLDASLVRGMRSGAAPLVLQPTQQHLIVADLHDEGSIAAALDLAAEAVQQPIARLASRATISLGPHGWQAVALQDSARTTTLRHLFDARMYGGARDLVTAANERLGIDDVIVPRYQAARKATGETMSTTSLTDDPDVRTFLPLADQVVLVRVDGSAVVPVPMERLRAIPGVATPVEGLSPTYLEVRRFPEELL